MDKITYEDFHSRVLFKTPKYNDYFKENFRVFDAPRFIALVTCHIPPKHKQLIRRYGVYASRSRGKWETQDYLVRLAPEVLVVPLRSTARTCSLVGRKRNNWRRKLQLNQGKIRVLSEQNSRGRHGLVGATHLLGYASRG